MSIAFSIPNVLAAQPAGKLLASELDANWNAIQTALSGLVAAMTDLPLGRAYTGTQRWAQGVALTAAATLNLGSDGNYFVVNGNTGITAISVLEAGTTIYLRFAGTPTLTHSANLILQGATDATAAAGDVYEFISEGGGVWREVTRRATPNADNAHFWRGDGVWGTPSTTGTAPKIGALSRNWATGSGDVAYVGVGFQPRAIQFFGGVSGNSAGHSLNGYDDGTSRGAISSDGANMFETTAYCIYSVVANGVTEQKAIVKTFDADGFTLTWTKVGAPAGAATYVYTAFP